MRIAPIFTQKSYSTAMGQAYQQRTNCKKPQSNINYDKGDIFMRLAEASMRNAKIELELKQMGLI